jgi:hypothetical protein
MAHVLLITYRLISSCTQFQCVECLSHASEDYNIFREFISFLGSNFILDSGEVTCIIYLVLSAFTSIPHLLVSNTVYTFLFKYTATP